MFSRSKTLPHEQFLYIRVVLILGFLRGLDARFQLYLSYVQAESVPYYRSWVDPVTLRQLEITGFQVCIT